MWRCTTCTFDNHDLMTRCEMCETPKPASGGASPSPRADLKPSLGMHSTTQRETAPISRPAYPSLDSTQRSAAELGGGRGAENPFFDTTVRSLDSSVGQLNDTLAGANTSVVAGGGSGGQPTGGAPHVSSPLRRASSVYMPLGEANRVVNTLSQQAGQSPWRDDKFISAQPEHCWQHYNELVCHSTTGNSHVKFHSVFGPTEKVQPDALQQGELGDCWFMSALAVLAHYSPESIHSLFLSVTNVFVVRLWVDGQWVAVAVDGFFPSKFGKVMQFGSSSDGSLWPALIEKAYAKVHGVYDHIVAGRTVDALQALTGDPGYTFTLPSKIRGTAESVWGGGDPDEIWVQLCSFETQRCVMGASCGGTTYDNEARDKGLRTNHAYGVVGLRTIRSRGRFVLLHNPWGKVGWTGRLSESCPEWSDPMLQNTLRSAMNQRGHLWLYFEDFLKYFANVDICRAGNYATVYTGAEMYVPQGICVRAVQLLCSATGSMYIRAVQPSRRRRRRHQPTGRHLHYDCAIVLSNDSNPSTARMALPCTDQITMLEAMVDPGMYTLYVISFQQHTCDDGPHPFVLNIHSEKRVEVIDMGSSRIPRDSPSVGLLVQRAFLGPNAHSLDGVRVKTHNLFEGVNVFVCSGSHAMVVIARNNTSRPVELTLDCTGSSNVFYARGSPVSSDVVPSNSTTTLQILVATANDGDQFQWGFKTSFTARQSTALPAGGKMAPESPCPVFATYPNV